MSQTTSSNRSSNPIVAALQFLVKQDPSFEKRLVKSLNKAQQNGKKYLNADLYAALVEHVYSYGVADLPWECGFRTNGALLPRGVFGDPDEDTNGDGVVNEDDAVDGDNQ